MRYLITILALSLFAISTNAQETGNQSQQPKAPTAGQVLTSHYARTYQVALRYNDYSVAKNALLNLLVENPQNDSILYSLSALYFQMQQYASAALSANDLVARNPEHLGALEIAANSLESLGATDKALDSYESLYLKTDDFQVLYKIAFLQYEVGRYQESLTNADILLGKKQAEELTAYFTIGKEQKEFPLKVALINLKGLVQKELGNNDKAKELFLEALKMSPEFTIAQENLASLSK